ncbi:MAG: methionine synthase [Planctomycetaceae bacterium]|nr:methionine synthase [Planctomycetaceae bacterium]
MHESIAELIAEGPVLTDGAWGTQMQARGLAVGACPDEWNLSNPQAVEEVAKAYVDAGSRVIITNTFGATSFCLARHGLADKVVQINRAGAEISKRAAGDRAKVFASMGPSGVMLMMGDVTPDQLRDAFAVQAQALAEGGADALVIETMSDPAEARIAVEAARTTGLPVVACMVFDSGKDHDRTMMGTTPEEAARTLEEAGADCIGSNCGKGIEGFLPICRRLREATDRPLWIKANAGLPKVVAGETVYTQTPDGFASHVPGLLEAGASFVGGCCGTTPEFIRAVGTVLKGGSSHPVA